MTWQHLKNLSRLILFGGTFDPIHNGHIQLANILFNTFKAPVIFMPTNGFTSYKPYSHTNSADREAMIKLAIKPNSNFIFESFELTKPTYTCTYKTLISIREELGYTLPIYFLIGSDSLHSLDTWDNWLELFNLTNFAVAKRETTTINMSKMLKNEITKRSVKDTSSFNEAYGKIYLMDNPNYLVSSTTIRQKLANKENIEQLVPRQVAQYINQHNLYQ